MPRFTPVLPCALIGALVVVSAACSSLPADNGRPQALAFAADRGRDVPRPADVAAWTRTRLAQPLTADAAVQLALVHNPRLRAEAAKLGFAAAEVYQAGRLANPVLQMSRLSTDDSGAHAQLGLGLALDFLGLITLPARQRYAAGEFEAAQLALGAAVIDLATETEIAWYRAAAAQNAAQLRDKVADAARASATLARRYFDAGNLSRKQLAAEQAAASLAQLAALSAQAEAATAHAALNRAIGLAASDDGWTLDAHLDDPPAQDESAEALLALAADARLDIASARRHAQALAARYHLVRRTRLIDGLQLGVEHERDFDGTRGTGPSLGVALPIFDFGRGRQAAAQSALDGAEAELDGLVLDASNGIRAGSAQLAAAKARALVYRDALIPQQETVVEQSQREANGMLIGTFELLAAKQQEIAAYGGYVESVRDYWIARAGLARTVGRQLPVREATSADAGRVETRRNGAEKPAGLDPPPYADAPAESTDPQAHDHHSQDHPP